MATATMTSKGQITVPAIEQSNDAIAKLGSSTHRLNEVQP